MKSDELLARFMQSAKDDPRLSPSHISLFVDILYLYQCQNCQMPLSVFRRDLIGLAKIGNRVYHSCVSDLKEWGYIEYLPSFNPVLGSLFYILKNEK
ncbi:MAG: hypothetical protein DI539_29555 [Flavobacterium psychrophilum]|nr:MAG: hypothetical protein DI539_29555 [Flavobacterium psychrophilum]